MKGGMLMHYTRIILALMMHYTRIILALSLLMGFAAVVTGCTPLL